MERAEHQSGLDRELIAAYRATRYRVRAPAPFDLTVDRHSPALEVLMRAEGVSGAAFVTAWNPRGVEQPLEANRARQDGLRKALHASGLRFVEGFGAHADDGSRGEESLLVLGPDRPDACALGVQLEQNAVLWSGPDAVPRLVLLR